jgi:hypothetical protein
VSELEFLSPDLAEPRDGFEPTLRSPVARALGTRGAELGIEDVSLSTGKIEVRGDINDLDLDGADVFKVTPERAVVLCAYDRTAAIRAEMRRYFRTVDMTGALAGIRIERPDAVTLMRRLTELDLDSLPAVGSVAHIQAYVLRDGETSFRLFFPQEYGDYVGDVVLDTAEGLE